MEWAGFAVPFSIWGPVNTKGQPVLLTIPTRESRPPGTQGECKEAFGFADNLH